MVAYRAICTCAIVFATSSLARADSESTVTIYGITKAASQALRREALAADGAEREIILRELMGIHDQALGHFAEFEQQVADRQHRQKFAGAIFWQAQDKT